MNENIRYVAIALTIALGLTGCASKQTRTMRAYNKYVGRASAARVKQQAKIRNSKPQMPTSPMPSQPVEKSEQGPQAMPSEESQH